MAKRRACAATSAIVLVAAGFAPTVPASAHGGGLNAEGCHKDRKRGGYHCHGGGRSVRARVASLILHDEDQDRWLTAPVEEALRLACAFPSQLIEVE